VGGYGGFGGSNALGLGGYGQGAGLGLGGGLTPKIRAIFIPQGGAQMGGGAW
jgi:hypothetical protein